MNNAKITVPPSVATAIRFFTDLADTKHEAFADILNMGYESDRSKLILSHFDGDYDLLMEALICGYQIEKSPEEKVHEYYERINAERKSLQNYASINNLRQAERYMLIERTIKLTLELLGIKIAGVNADE
jgi:hypothetical protein